MSEHYVRGVRIAGLRFRARELRDLAVAWLALSVAFTVILEPRITDALLAGTLDPGALVAPAIASLLVVGTGFLLHELAHKVVAVRFGQLAEFRADYSMLGLAVLAALAGFLFAAPGAVYHRGRITQRENGLIALAGPAVNVALALGFLVLAAAGPTYLGAVGEIGLFVNLLLAGFNMLPFGPLDGRKVLDWSRPVFAVSFTLTAGPAVLVLFG